MKPYRRHDDAPERDFMWAMASTLLVGAMLGATITLGVLSL